MRAILLPLTLAVWAAAEAAIPVPDREVTDPASVTSPVNSVAAPVPIEDLVVTRGVGDVAWSVDGRHVFIATNLTGRYNIWRIDSGGSWPVQLTVSDEAQTALVRRPMAGHFSSPRRPATGIPTCMPCRRPAARSHD